MQAIRRSRPRPAGTPDPPRAGPVRARGGPTTIATLTGRMPLFPLGMAHSLPPMPTGTIGTPARAATKAAPSKRGCTVGPDWRVPSGNRTTGSPAPQGLLAAAQSLAVRGAPMHRERARAS